MMPTAESPRRELGEYANSGNLRRDTEGRVSAEAADLLVTVVLRYCEPRRRPKTKGAAA